MSHFSFLFVLFCLFCFYLFGFFVVLLLLFFLVALGIVDIVGFTEITMNLDLMNNLSGKEDTMLSLGVVLDIIVFVLIVLSIMLLYSLLVISVDTRTFELGVFRMVGMARSALITMLLTQSLSYSLPSYVIGLIIAQISAVVVLYILGSSADLTLDASLSSYAITIATVVGIGCSILASILPINSALNQNLRDSLDTRHSKTKAVEFSIERSEDSTRFSWTIFSIGSVMILFGWIIFYFMPYSFLAGDLTLLAIMLLSLMLSMLLGLILIAFNIEHILERLILTLFLFWEARPIPDIVLKNLVAHRRRNRKTTLMYSLSLSFIFFVTVMIETDLTVLEMGELRYYGTYMFCWTHNAGEEFESQLDELVDNGYLSDFSWKPGPIWASHYGNNFYVSYTESTNIGGYFEEGSNVYPVLSNTIDVVIDDYIVDDDNGVYNSGLSDFEMLFSATGSQRGLIGSHIQDTIGLENLNTQFLLHFLGNNNNNKYVRLKSMGWYKLFPFYYLTARHSSWNYQDVLIPITRVASMFNGVESIDDAWITALFIKFKPNVVNSEKDYVKDILNDYCYSVFDYRTIEKYVAKAEAMLDLVFSFTTYTALFLCLFSLVASMYSNILEQTKEIGILRAMGLTNFEITKIYVYESCLLVLTSSLLGIAVGSLLAFVIIQQQILFTQYPLEFIVPQAVLLAVITGAIITSVIAVYLPLRKLSKIPVAQVMRMLL